MSTPHEKKTKANTQETMKRGGEREAGKVETRFQNPTLPPDRMGTGLIGQSHTGGGKYSDV